MIDVKDIPAIRALIEQGEAQARPEAEAQVEVVEYARAPDGPGYRPTGRPPAMQRNNR
jgi:hypothetical protein